MLIEAQQAGREPVVLFIGDFDPSGAKIRESFLEKLEMWGVRVAYSEVVAVTAEQVRDFDLPSKIETAREAEKFRRQHGVSAWLEKYGEVRVETAAFRNRHPDEFEAALRAAVLRHFSAGIREQALQLEQARTELMRVRMREFRGRVHKWLDELLVD